MKYIKSPKPKWLNKHLLWMDVKRILKALFWLFVLEVACYSAVYHIIGPMPTN